VCCSDDGIRPGSSTDRLITCSATWTGRSVRRSRKRGTRRRSGPHDIESTYGRFGNLSSAAWAALHAIDVELRDLRHEGAQRAFAFGELNQVQALLGHKDISTTRIYLNADVAGVRSMIEAWDAERTDRGYLNLMKTPSDRKIRGK